MSSGTVLSQEKSAKSLVKTSFITFDVLRCYKIFLAFALLTLITRRLQKVPIGSD